MKLAYAFRRGTFYPHIGEQGWQIPVRESTRASYLKHVREIGFDGIELGLDSFGGLDAPEAQVREFGKELTDAGTPCVAIRAGGGLCQPNVVKQNRKRLEKAVEVAGWLGVGTVNTALGTPPRNRTLPNSVSGGPIGQGNSQLATEEDFIRTANILHEVGEDAGANDIDITIEVHQHTIADNSWSTLHLLELTDSPNVFANPDLGNIYWNYDVPEESSDDAIVALAPHSKYWHCKNLHRVYSPELERSYYVRVPLPDGDIDYRFALSAMVEADYDGYLAIEGADKGDQLSKDKKSVEYVKGILSELEA